ncbi:hypothetical protein QJS10_CPA01g01986 [Acorus calamus]|uniref:RNase H type-1 domain-containing protein n=1 Tax=Acorus calamus TaxID=4465 RepID=A0AAV9FIG5_ACOCL|nr:hypothetical protein QJS10_CPA01g01986 [Acorus calamus]
MEATQSSAEWNTTSNLGRLNSSQWLDWNENPWELRRGSVPSPVWRAMCEGMRIARKLVIKTSGNMADIDLIRDSWLTPIPFARIPTFLNMDRVNLDYHLSQDNVWDKTRNGKMHQLVFIAMLWKVWVTRNRLIFQGESHSLWITSTRAILQAHEYYDSFLIEQSREEVHMSTLIQKVVIPRNNGVANRPQQRRAIIITDGSMQAQTRATGAGFIIIQEEPNRVISAGYTSWPWAGVLKAELGGILLGITEALRMGFRDIIVCSDAEIILRLLRSTETGTPSLQSMVEQIREDTSNVNQIQYIKVPRDCVRGSEALAKMGRNMQRTTISQFLQDNNICNIVSQNWHSVHSCLDLIRTQGY